MSLESYNAKWPCYSVTKLETIGFPTGCEHGSVTFQLRIMKHGRVAPGDSFGASGRGCRFQKNGRRSRQIFKVTDRHEGACSCQNGRAS